MGTEPWNIGMVVPAGQPLPVAVQFLRQAMRLPYNFRIQSFPESNNPRLFVASAVSIFR
jgi:hypothetical protein